MIIYPQLTIYYFSGTGNSRNVAIWFSAAAEKMGIPSTASNISEINRLSITPPPHDSLIVFTSPVHGFNYPPVMLNFIARFPKGKNKVLLMNTRAGMLIGKWNVPGLSGITFLLSSLILKLKGYSIVGMVPVDLPSNWISLHPGLNDRTIKILHEKNKARVVGCAQKILTGDKDFRALHEIVQDIVIAPISLGYYLVGRFVFAKTFYASSDCNHCDLCINQCPVKAIVKIDSRPFWTFKCESCMHCISHCPKRAIETAHGFIISYAIAASFITAIFFKYFDSLFFEIKNVFIQNVVEIIIFLFFLGIFYRAVHYLMRLKPFERLMVYTSLTKYKFWGKRYRALKEE